MYDMIKDKATFFRRILQNFNGFQGRRRDRDNELTSGQKRVRKKKVKEKILEIKETITAMKANKKMGQ